MSLRHVIAAVFILSTAGCIENMGDLKEALGVVPPPAAAPAYVPPTAVIDAMLGGATVGAPVRLLGEESVDPQGLALLHSWDFGDGTLGEGAAVTHVYDEAGEYLVRLTVTNAAGLSDDDTLALTVSAIDRAPTVALRAPASGILGEDVAFQAFASDPEGSALVYDWDFGDGSTLRCDQDGCWGDGGASVAGATSHDASPTHAYAKPGVYDVSVRVTDAAGQRATDAARVAIDGLWRFEGAFEPAGGEPAKILFPVVAGARSIDITLSFDAGLGGLNDLEIVVLDAKGNEVARTDGGLGGAPERALELDARHLAATGEWAVRLVKDSGVAATWSLEIVERLS